ncbi:MAG TPA: hypothetical protein VLK27_09960 [Chthoniobacterales bacterium]|nr:hypothetical protein [Chthoniobacterales bacterium]
MIAAAHPDNFLFLIFFVVAILFQLLARAAKTGRRSGDDSNRRSTSAPETPRSTSRQSEETEEDRVRKFLEALGQPTTSKPPPPVATRPSYQKPIVLPRAEPRRIARPVISPLPPLTTRPPESHFPTGHERRVFQPKAQIPAFEVQAGSPPLTLIRETEGTASFEPAAGPASSNSEPKIDVATLLRSTSGLRNAIILREIFGPPRSLQRLDLVGNV